MVLGRFAVVTAMAMGFVSCQSSPGAEIEALPTTSTAVSPISDATTPRAEQESTKPADTTSTTPNTTKNVCRPDPFSQGVSGQLARTYPGQDISAHLYDSRTGCEYQLNSSNRQPTASVFKVMVLAGTLLEAQGQSRDLTEWEISQLTPMITESANEPVRALWRSFGGAPWFENQVRIFDLRETTVTADTGSAWGLTQTSARDQVNLIRQVLLGEWGPIEDQYRTNAVNLMTSVVSSQTWGVTAGVPPGWTVAQKNGFAGATINSVGWVDAPGESNGYVLAIMSTGWPNHAAGIAAVEAVSILVATQMVDLVPGVE